MELATQTHLHTLRELLVYRQHELRTEVQAAVQARREPGDNAEHEVADQKDEAARQVQSEVDAAQERRDVDELAQVDAALHRLDLGVYGDCADCAEPIALPRLMVQPAATRCAACQSAREHAAEHGAAARHP